MLATEFQVGELVQDDPVALADPATYRQAGVLLAAFHHQKSVKSHDYWEHANSRSIRWLSANHRIPVTTVDALRSVLNDHHLGPVELVPTHGDWHTRNWLADMGVVSVIDLGRADLRPALTDLTRLAHHEWMGHPEQESAFFDGYETDPRDPAQWRAALLHEAIGTAVWAFQVGDRDFEAQGHRMIDSVLEMY